MLEYQILKISCQKINYFTLCKKNKKLNQYVYKLFHECTFIPGYINITKNNIEYIITVSQKPRRTNCCTCMPLHKQYHIYY